jgi:alpha-L-fucosidase 2
LASNHADLLGVFNNMYSRNSAALKAYTMTRYNVAGIWVP